MTKKYLEKTILYLCGASLLLVLTAQAQFVLPGTLPIDKSARVPLSAVVKTTVSSNTPSGSFTQSQEGKYWRSGDGKTRQDTSFGSVITDSKARTIIHLNHTKKEATVIQMPPSPPPSSGCGRSTRRSGASASSPAPRRRRWVWPCRARLRN